MRRTLEYALAAALVALAACATVPDKAYVICNTSADCGQPVNVVIMNGTVPK